MANQDFKGELHCFPTCILEKNKNQDRDLGKLCNFCTYQSTSSISSCNPPRIANEHLCLKIAQRAPRSHVRFLRSDIYLDIYPPKLIRKHSKLSQKIGFYFIKNGISELLAVLRSHKNGEIPPWNLPFLDNKHRC